MHISIPWKTNFFYRSHLSPLERRVYDALLKGMQDWQPLISLPSGCTTERLVDLCTIVKMDVPMFFHVGHPKSLRSNGGQTVLLELDYSMDEQSYCKLFQQVQQFLNRTARMLGGRNILIQLCSLHNSIIKHVLYHDSSSQNEHNVLGAILERKAVCESIAKAFKLMCDVNRIPCGVVFGYSEQNRDFTQMPPRVPLTDNHAWNLVYLEGAWYQVDVTHDLGLTQNDWPYVQRYEFFLRSDQVFLRAGHLPSPGLPLPPCPRSYDVYRSLGMRADSAAQLRALMQQAANQGETILTLQIGSEWNVQESELRGHVTDYLNSVTRFRSVSLYFDPLFRMLLIQFTPG